MGTDLGLALSGSSTATSGFSANFANAFGGDFIVGGKKATPVWVWVALAAAAVVVAVVYLIRK